MFERVKGLIGSFGNAAAHVAQRAKEALENAETHQTEIIGILPDTADTADLITKWLKIASAENEQPNYFTSEMLAELVPKKEFLLNRVNSEPPYIQGAMAHYGYLPPDKDNDEHAGLILSMGLSDDKTAIIPRVLSVGPDFDGGVILYRLSCCDTTSVNAASLIFDADKDAFVVLSLPSLEGATMSMVDDKYPGQILEGIDILYPDAEQFAHALQHIRGKQHACSSAPQIVSGAPAPTK